MKKSLGAKTLIWPTPVLLVGSYDTAGSPNVMNAAWGGIASSNPPSVSVGIRPGRHTHAGILAHRAFTIGIPSAQMAKAADHVGMYSGKDEDKWIVTGLTPVRSGAVDAPYVSECPLVLECRLSQTVDLGVHTLFIGEIVDVKADESILDAESRPDVAKADPMLFSPSDGNYYRIGELVGKAFSIGRKE